MEEEQEAENKKKVGLIISLFTWFQVWLRNFRWTDQLECSFGHVINDVVITFFCVVINVHVCVWFEPRWQLLVGRVKRRTLT